MGVGGAAIGALTFVGECTILLAQSFARLFRRPFEWEETLRMMAFVGAASVPIVALTTFSSGSVLALYSAELLDAYGAGGLAGATVGLSVAREIAPVLAGIMVAARCGSAMAAQIASMKVSEQIDALRSMNVHPVSFLVVPRVVAGLTMLPILGLVGGYAGVFGGFVVATQAAGIPDTVFLDSLRRFVEPDDIWKGMLKTVVFGLIVAVVACQQGMAANRGAEGVGRATTNTVVITMVLIYVANYFLTALMFG